MFCPNCGAQVDDTAKVCPNCGAKCGNEDFSSKVNDFANNVGGQAKTYFNEAEDQLKDAVGEIKSDFNGNSDPGERLNDNRGLASYIILSIITCGIYSYYFIYKLAHDVNIACEGDGQETSGLVAFILLSIITCGIYAWVWYYKLGNRLQLAGSKYQLTIQENGTTVLLWLIFGSFICGIGAFVAMHILIKNSNLICGAYNREHGFV